MKLLVEPTLIESSGTFKSEQFAIGDISVILEILRSKIYSNPIHVICQEIMSNARDAHREIGKFDVPIEITFPTSFDNSIHIRDFGPGISPQRMADVFVKYGTSTKRGDNIQTGGFGLGAKTPFAYSDSFSIVSITPNADGRMMRRQYIAYIDESKIGTMSLVSEAETKEAQGTTVVITPKPNDTPRFIDSALQVSKYWKVRPNIHPKGTIVWPEPKIKYAGTDWEIDSDNEVAKIVIDGIPYPLNRNIIENHLVDRHNRDSVKNLLDKSLALHFGIGELKITASREAIDYQPDTIGKIISRLKAVLPELRLQTSAVMANAKNLWEASILWNDFSKHFSMDLGEWGGFTIGRTLEISEQVATIYVAHRNQATGRLPELTRNGNNSYCRSSISFNIEAILVEDDTGLKRPSRSRLATLFDKHPNIEKVYVVSFEKNVSPDYREAKLQQKRWLAYEPLKLSAYEYKPQPKTNKSPAPIVKLRQLVKNAAKEWVWEPCDEGMMTEDSGIYVIKKANGFYVAYTNAEGVLCKNEIPHSTLADISSANKITIFSVLERYESYLESGWKKLSTWIEEEIATLEADPDVQKFALTDDARNGFAFKFNNIASVFHTKKLIANLNPDSLFVEYVNMSSKYDDCVSQIQHLECLRNLLGIAPKPGSVKILETLFSKVRDKYLLLAHLDHQYSNNKALLDEIQAYIRLKDGTP